MKYFKSADHGSNAQPGAQADAPCVAPLSYTLGFIRHMEEIMVTKDILLNGEVVGSYETTGDDQKDIEVVRAFLRQKGLHKEVTVNDSMYGQANSFAQLANDLYEKGLKTSPYKGECISPFVVNAVFSVELYLKTIHNVYGNNIRGHHLANIYKGIPKRGKEHFDSASVDVRGHYQLAAGTDIQSCLYALSKAFEEWRYLYEQNRIGTEVQSIRYTMHVAHEACCRARSDAAKKT